MNWNTLLSSQRSGQKQVITSEPSRSAFEQDYDRIIFSHPFRKLQDKTQVHPLPEHDFVHTRLTHSLEVSSVGRSLGKRVGEIILQRHPELAKTHSVFDFGAIVSAASLAHDLGNPPFGHAGEDAISDFFLQSEVGLSLKNKMSEAEWTDLTKFEGNAQGFRILNKNQYGLKLAFATLGAFTKYPCPAFFPQRDKLKRSQKKFGFFQSEKQIFNEVASALELPKVADDAYERHPLTYLVEAADDICYNIIDLEDGCNLGILPYTEAKSLLENVLTKSRSKLGKLDSIDSISEKIGYLRAVAISDLADEFVEIFLANEQNILNGVFNKALADIIPSKSGLKEIGDVSKIKIYRAKNVIEKEASGHQALPGLMEEFLKAGLNLYENKKSRKYENLAMLFPEDILHKLTQTKDHYTIARLITDFISGLTDRHAISLYKKIKGLAV